MSRIFFFRAAPAFALCVTASVLVPSPGCKPSVNWEIVQAKSGVGFQQWRARAAQKLTVAEREELDGLLDELRWSQPGATQEDVYARIDGKSLAEVRRLGYQARLDRLNPLWDELKEAIDANALMMTRAGDDTAAAELRRRRQDQHERLDRMSAQLDETEKRLAALAGRPHAARQRDSKPRSLSRAEALQEIQVFAEKRRAAAFLRYGEWPVQIDETGTLLPENERADFLRRRATAPADGRSVLAIRVRDKWWIYDAPREPFPFSAALVGNLTEGDRASLQTNWTVLLAELWARQQSWEENKDAKESPPERPGPLILPPARL